MDSPRSAHRAPGWMWTGRGRSPGFGLLCVRLPGFRQWHHERSTVRHSGGGHIGFAPISRLSSTSTARTTLSGALQEGNRPRRRSSNARRRAAKSPRSGRCWAFGSLSKCGSTSESSWNRPNPNRRLAISRRCSGTAQRLAAADFRLETLPIFPDLLKDTPERDGSPIVFAAPVHDLQDNGRQVAALFGERVEEASAVLRIA